jgi:hypothetical protein
MQRAIVVLIILRRLRRANARRGRIRLGVRLVPFRIRPATLDITQTECNLHVVRLGMPLATNLRFGHLTLVGDRYLRTADGRSRRKPVSRDKRLGGAWSRWMVVASIFVRESSISTLTAPR